MPKQIIKVYCHLEAEEFNFTLWFDFELLEFYNFLGITIYKLGNLQAFLSHPEFFQN